MVYERDEAGDAYDQMAQTSPVAMGVGYWIATAMIGETIDVDGLSPSTDVALESSGSGVQNLVGHPFAFDVCWADVRVVDGSSLLTLDEADPAGECETRRLFPCVIRRWRHHRHLGISTQSADSTAFPRGRFIEEFWRERDPDPRTVRNELLDDWKIRVAAVRASYPSAGDVRARMMLLNGLPTERVEVNCRGTTWPIEVWFYVFTERFREPFALIFYRRWGVGDWQLWGDDPENTKDLYNTSTFTGEALGKPGGTLFAKPSQCNFDALLAAFKIIRELKLKGVDYMMLLYELTEPDRPDADEWVRTFTSYSTDLPEGAATFPVDIRFDFPGWHQNRTVVQGLVSVPSAELEATDLRGYASYNLAMNGEVLLGDDTLEYLHRSGVTVYSIGLALDGSSARRVLRRFAEETGGRSFFLDSVAELAAAYAVIREELRTKYLLAYQSANTSGSDEFRRVEVKLVRRGLKARTMRGYYP